MDFTFLANAGATPATATLTNFDGLFGVPFDLSPGVAFTDRGVLGNQNGGDYLTLFVTLGGLLSFDISFDGAFATTENVDESQFSATLYNADLTGYIGAAGSFAEFALVPQINGNPGGVTVAPPGGLASVTAVANVPEPSSLLLALGALAMLGLARYKRSNSPLTELASSFR
jgi:hypothetical protein